MSWALVAALSQVYRENLQGQKDLKTNSLVRKVHVQSIHKEGLVVNPRYQFNEIKNHHGNKTLIRSVKYYLDELTKMGQSNSPLNVCSTTPWAARGVSQD